MKKFKQDLKELGKDCLCGLKYIGKFIVIPIWWIKFIVDERQGKDDKDKRPILKTASQLIKICCVKDV